MARRRQIGMDYTIFQVMFGSGVRMITIIQDNIFLVRLGVRAVVGVGIPMSTNVSYLAANGARLRSAVIIMDCVFPYHLNNDPLTLG